MLLLLLACTAPSPLDDTAPTDSAPYVPPAGEVISLTTADGVTLEADWYDNAPGSPAVLLLHMIPPSYDRSSWPNGFIEGLVEDGYAVLALDRRGAGGSGGNAEDAYNGDLGVNDAYAAVDHMVAADHDRLVIIGASNGTTTLLDYTKNPDGRPVPEALVLMSGGTYTETNSLLGAGASDHMQFLYPSSEADWNEALFGTNDGWVFIEYEGNAHGTDMFRQVDTVEADIRGFLAET